jgi:GntR family transcriptional regulator
MPAARPAAAASPLASAPPGLSRYAALAEALRTRIVAGEWPPGRALPSEELLAAEHGVALGTLRRALEQLAEQGLVERVHGRGTFVRQGLSGAPMMRFFRFGGRPGETPHSRILARDTATPPAEVAQALGSAGPALRLRRLRSLAGAPVLWEESWLPLPLFGALADGDTAAWGDLLYPLFAERCGVHVHRAVDTIGFVPLPAAAARALKLATGHPGARVQRRAHDLAGRCIECRTTLGDAHAFQYTVSIT